MHRALLDMGRGSCGGGVGAGSTLRAKNSLTGCHMGKSTFCLVGADSRPYGICDLGKYLSQQGNYFDGVISCGRR